MMSSKPDGNIYWLIIEINLEYNSASFWFLLRKYIIYRKQYCMFQFICIFFGDS